MKQYIAGSLVASILAVLTTVCAPGAYAGDVVTWTDASEDHRWDNAKNWEPQVVPDFSKDVHIPTGDWRIVRPAGSPYYGIFSIDDGYGTVTLEGEGAGTTMCPATRANFRIGEGRQFAVTNGLTLQLSYTTPVTAGVMRVRSGGSVVFNNNNVAESTIGGSARIFVEGGTFLNEKTGLHIMNNAEIVVSDGLMHTRYYRVYGPDSPGDSGALLRITGGTLWNDYSFACWSKIYSGGRFENLGGTILWGADSDDRYAKLGNETGHVYSSGDYGFSSFLPPKGGKLNLLSRDGCTFNGGTDNAGALYFAVTGDYSFGGEIFATNTAAAAVDTSGFVCFEDGKTSNLTGGGTIYANGFMMRKQNVANIDISALYLGRGGIQQGQTCVTRFVNDLVLGAWGDWSAMPGTDGRITFAGAATFDTLDCFDGTTTHTIGMTADIAEATELKAVGGGTVTLAAQTEKNELRLIEVGAGTTFNLTGNMKTMNLTLGDGATLGLDISSGGYLDAAATASFGEGAKIAVTALPATLAEGMFYPVYSAPAGTDPDLSKIEYAKGDWPTGWHLAKRGCAVYLTDGREPVHSDSNKYAWSGGGADNLYSNMDNWLGFINTGGGADIYYNGRKNTDIYIDNTYIVQRRWYFGADAGPFLFSGNVIRFQYPTSFSEGWTPSIHNNSRFPVVVSNNLATQNIALWMAARQQGSISLMGLGGMNTTLNGYVPLFVGGDIRIGGAYTSEYVRVASDVWDAYVKRATRLTIMPGGSLKVLNQSGDFHERGVSGYAASDGVTGGALAVATGGVLDIAGTELLFTCDTTHYVDGAMTVSCPLVPQGRQTFRGDGTLTLSGGVSSAAGGVRVEGNLTLVPSDWKNDVELSVKDNVTIAPTDDWTFGGDASIDLDDHSTLTLATGGHKLRLAKPLVSRGTLSVAGNGTVEIATEGMSLDKVRMADGATFSVARNILSRGTQVDVLTVRDDDDSITFSADVPKLNKRVDERGYAIYSVKGGAGLSIFIR